MDGDARVLRVLGDSADALGRLIALAATFTLQDVAIVAGEGIGLLAVAEERVRSTIAALQHPGSTPLQLFVDRTGFSAWARGAAAVAIQSAVSRLTLR